MISNALEGKRLPVYGDGLNERDWIFVEDHCRALDIILQFGKPGEVYNIGFGQPTTNLEIVRLLLKLLGRTEQLIEFVADRPGHDRRYALATQKIRLELGWQPTVGIQEGLAQCVDWYRAHADWVDRIKSGEYQAYYHKFYEVRQQTLAQI
jgi:dTDP-glucose 4,6-dehydratase